MKCISCQNEIQDGLTTCPICGTQQNAVSAPVEQAPVQQPEQPIEPVQPVQPQNVMNQTQVVEPPQVVEQPIQQPVPEPTNTKKSKIGLIIVLVVVLVLGAAIAFVVFFGKSLFNKGNQNTTTELTTTTKENDKKSNDKDNIQLNAFEEPIILYLDPTDLDRKCTKEEADQNVNQDGQVTGIKTGCMKWFIYGESGDSYAMILDHNTKSIIKWNKKNENVEYESSLLKPIVDDLVTTSGWKVTPRLITVSEINAITGNKDFNSSDDNSWYYLDSLTQHLSTNRKFNWLYSNLMFCSTYGTDCKVKDLDAPSGYWTSTVVGDAREGAEIWAIDYQGRLVASNVLYYGSGIRPVITVPKSQVEVNKN